MVFPFFRHTAAILFYCLGHDDAKAIPLAGPNSNTRENQEKNPRNVLLAGIMTRTPAAEAGSSEAGLKSAPSFRLPSKDY